MDSGMRKVLTEIANLSDVDFERYCDIINREVVDCELEEILHNYKNRLERLRK